MSLIFDIKRYSINDGPGIRLTIFFKGCPLNCIWCHNPEGISPKREKLYKKEKCLQCKSCVAACPNSALALEYNDIITDTNLCLNCGECTEVCPTGAMEMSGREISVEEIMEEITNETILFDNSDGGVTFCGGEPLMHRELLLTLLKQCRSRKIHTAVDTSLYADEAVVKEVALNCDLILADLKHTDPHLHQKYTGQANAPILSNIKMLSREEFDFWIRIPLIEGINADEPTIRAMAKFISSLEGRKKPPIELLPYHDIGKGKHGRLGTIYNKLNIPMSQPSKERILECQSIFSDYNLITKVRL